jgi:release factor glutamine methyltransferase
LRTDYLLKSSSQLLQKISDSPALDCEVLLLHALNKFPHGKLYHRAFLRTWPEYELKADQLQFFNTSIKQRLDGKPVAYITGFKEFWSLNLQVNEHTLIPRPDTEILVEQALELIPEHTPWRILDLGTGSGAIALAIASERKKCQIIATDKSFAAIQVARANAHRLNISNCQFINASWLDGLKKNSFQMIVSNPPYIKEDDPHLKQIALQHEPSSALSSADNGLQDIQNIINNAGKHLSHPGYLLLEHGYDQAEQVKILLAQYDYQFLSQVRDHNDILRVSIGVFKN